jgi:hypothetical protein
MKLALGKDLEKFTGAKASLVSPYSNSAVLQNVLWKGSTLEAGISSIDIYSVMVLEGPHLTQGPR